MKNQFNRPMKSMLLILLCVLMLSFQATAVPSRIVTDLQNLFSEVDQQLAGVENELLKDPTKITSDMHDRAQDYRDRLKTINDGIVKLTNTETKSGSLTDADKKIAAGFTRDLRSLRVDVSRLGKDVADALRPSTQVANGNQLPDLTSYLTSSLLFWVLIAAIALALLLHATHLIGAAGTRRQLEELKANVKLLARATAPGNTGSAAVTGLAEQLLQQGQSVQQLSGQVEQIDQRLSLNERDDQDLADSIVRITRWIGDDELRSASASNGNQMDDGTRRAMLQVIERNREPLSANAARIEPLKQAFLMFITRLNELPQLPPELMTRARNLQSNIEVFSDWQRDVDSEFNALQLGSTRARQSRLYAEHDKLIAQLENRQITISDHIQEYRRVLDYYLSTGPSNTDTAAPMEYETELRNRASGAADLLMDWFDGLFQLYILFNSLARATPSAFEPDALAELSQVQKLARDVLSKFDVQPEEIQVGRTSYDRRLHEAALIRQSGQVPANTVIGVQRCGFRRVSTGEVLRRPHVVVAGASAG